MRGALLCIFGFAVVLLAAIAVVLIAGADAARLLPVALVLTLAALITGRLLMLSSRQAGRSDRPPRLGARLR